MLFNLAAKLECIGIHTYDSICDGAGKNRAHIKSLIGMLQLGLLVIL